MGGKWSKNRGALHLVTPAIAGSMAISKVALRALHRHHCFPKFPRAMWASPVWIPARAILEARLAGMTKKWLMRRFSSKHRSRAPFSVHLLLPASPQRKLGSRTNSGVVMAVLHRHAATFPVGADLCIRPDCAEKGACSCGSQLVARRSAMTSFRLFDQTSRGGFKTLVSCPWGNVYPPSGEIAVKPLGRFRHARRSDRRPPAP